MTIPQDRLLMFVGLGGSVMLATLIFQLFQKTYVWQNRFLKTAAAGMAVTMLGLHLILSPIMFPLISVLMGKMSAPWMDAALNLPIDGDISDKKIVIINAPTRAIMYLAALRYIYDYALPMRIWHLSTDGQRTHFIKQASDTLVVEPENGFLTADDVLFRAVDDPFMVHDKIVLNGLTINVLKLNEKNYPDSVSFTFDEPMSNEHMVFLTWKNNRFVKLNITDLSNSFDL